MPNLTTFTYVWRVHVTSNHHRGTPTHHGKELEGLQDDAPHLVGGRCSMVASVEIGQRVPGPRDRGWMAGAGRIWIWAWACVWGAGRALLWFAALLSWRGGGVRVSASPSPFSNGHPPTRRDWMMQWMGWDGWAVDRARSHRNGRSTIDPQSIDAQSAVQTPSPCIF